ncbi:MAG: hypothetical protein ACD_28C00150G0008, partial [uncultured bacterium]
LNRPLTVEEMALQLSSFENQTVDLLYYHSVPKACADFSHFEMSEGPLLVRWYCMNGDQLQSISFMSKELLSLAAMDSNVRNSLIPYLKKPNPFSFSFSSPEHSTISSKYSLKEGLSAYKTTVLGMDFLLLIFVFFLLSPRQFYSLFHIKQRSNDLTLKAGLDLIKAQLLTRRERARHHPLISLLCFFSLLLIVFIFIEIPWNALLVGMQADGLFLFYLTLSLILALFFVSFLFPEHLKEFLSRMNVLHQSRFIPLTSFQYRVAFLGFTFLCTLFLYDFFLFQKTTDWLWIFIFLSGSLIFFSKSEFRPLLNRLEIFFIRFNQALMIGLPFVFLISIFNPYITTILPPVDFKFNAVESGRPTRSISPLLDHPGKNTAWVLPENVLLLHSPFSVHGPKSLLNRPIPLHFGMKVRSNVSLHAKTSDGTLQPLFIPTPQNLSLVRQFDSIGVYRLTTSTSIETGRTKNTTNWADFIKTGFLKNSVLGINLIHYGFNMDDFLSTQNPVKNNGTNALDLFPYLTIENDSFVFYTYNSQNALSFSFDFEGVTSKMNGEFILIDEHNNRIEEKSFSLTSDHSQFKLNLPKAPNGLYRFYFNFTEPITLSHLAVNSGYLVLKTSHLAIAAPVPMSFYFKPYANSFSYESDSGQSFGGDGGLIQTQDKMVFARWVDFLEQSRAPSLTRLSLPAKNLILTSSIDTLYSFTEKSWFNPFKFYFSDDPEYVQYWIIENYSLSESLEKGWSEARANLEITPSNGELPLEIHFDPSIANAWILLDTLSMTPL